MSEVLVSEKKFKEGGFRLYVDKELKLVKDVWNGKCDTNELEQGLGAVKVEMLKYNKGEALLLHETSNLDMKLWSAEQAKIAKDYTLTAVSYFKKTAFVYTSFMHQKATESATGALPDNFKYCTSEQEARKFLLS